MSIEIDGKRYSWNQGICVACWNQREALRGVNARPAVPVVGETRYVVGDVRRCSYCGGGTTSGILVRDDPRTVPFPQRDDDDLDTDEDRSASLSVSTALVLDIGWPEE